MQNWMPPNPNRLWQGAQGTPQQPWTGNQFGSMPMENQPGMSPGSPTQSYPDMPAYSGPSQTQGSFLGGHTGGLPAGWGIDSPTAPSSFPHSFGSMPGGSGTRGPFMPGVPGATGTPQRPTVGAPPPHGFHINQTSGSPLGTGGTAQHAPQSFPNFPAPTGGPGSTITPTPIAAQTPGIQPPPGPSYDALHGQTGGNPQNGAAQFGGASGYVGGGNSGGIGVPNGGPSSDPATLQMQQANNAAAFHNASQSQGNNNVRNNFNPAAAGIGLPMQTGLGGIPTPGATYNPSGGASLAPSSNWSPTGAQPGAPGAWLPPGMTPPGGTPGTGLNPGGIAFSGGRGGFQGGPVHM